MTPPDQEVMKSNFDGSITSEKVVAAFVLRNYEGRGIQS